MRRTHPIHSVAFYLVFLAASLSAPAWAHDIITTKLTYVRDIQPIFARRCLACHTDSQAIPLTRYEEVRPWAVSIKEQVLGRMMPPWGAVKGFGPIFPDQALTEEETMLIAAWVVGGAPEGSYGKPASETPIPVPTPIPALLTETRISTTQVLTRHVRISAIRPRATSLVVSTRITATLPDGSIRPLVWLFHYNPQWNHDFWFREPIDLPAGTRVSANPALQFALLTASRVTGPSPR